MRLRFSSILTIFFLAIGCTTTPDSPKHASENLRVGSWNIEWLDNPAMRSGPAKGVQQSAEDLADYIGASGVSVLALQELATNAPDGSSTSDTLNAALAILNRDGDHRWRHVIFPSSRNQNVGVAWDELAVTALSDTAGHSIPLDRAASADGGALWSRPPRALYFTAGVGLTDFVIIPIHMKSNYGGDFSERRAAEARALAAALPEIESTFADHDVFIIGDTNSPHHTDESIRAFEAAGLIDLNAGDAVTYWRGSSLDRALVPAAQPEFASPGFVVFFDEFAGPRGIDLNDFKVRWSDHRMVVFTLRVMADDD